MSKRYPLILAIDEYGTGIEHLVRNACDYVAGFKVGLPLALEAGLEYVRKIKTICNQPIWILDLKLADIAYVMMRIARLFHSLADAIIAHGFVGGPGALSELKTFLEKRGVKLIVVSTMSHEGAKQIYDKVLPKIVWVLEEISPWGIVAPATRPTLISWLRRLFPKTKILSPGIGVQGARPGTALCYGADYEIVGRAVTYASNPLLALRDIGTMQMEALEKCKTRHVP